MWRLRRYAMVITAYPDEKCSNFGPVYCRNSGIDQLSVLCIPKFAIHGTVCLSTIWTKAAHSLSTLIEPGHSSSTVLAISNLITDLKNH